jgi:hypothetical protein
MKVIVETIITFKYLHVVDSGFPLPNEPRMAGMLVRIISYPTCAVPQVFVVE